MQAHDTVSRGCGGYSPEGPTTKSPWRSAVSRNIMVVLTMREKVGDDLFVILHSRASNRLYYTGRGNQQGGGSNMPQKHAAM